MKETDRNDLPRVVTAAACLDDVVTTERLASRPSRPPNYEAESLALVHLAKALAEAPETILQRLVDSARQLTGAGSAGISVLEQNGDQPEFRWRATSGAFAPFLGGTLPRAWSPCGTVLDRNATQLMSEPVRFWPYIADLNPPVDEVLLVPFYQGETPIGTVWVVAHSDEKRFDSEDARLVTGLSRFASAAVQTLNNLDRLETTNYSLQQAAAERRQTEVELADAMPQIVWAATPDGVLDYYNRRWFDYINLPAEADLADITWDRYIHPDDLAAAYHRWSDCLRSGEPYAIEFRVRGGDGSYRWFLARALAIRSDSGEIRRWYGTCTDIHEQKGLEEENRQLLESERAARAEAERISYVKDEFLATLSHELRTPLNAILGWSQILRRNVKGSPEDLKDGLETIERNARAQTQIIEDLLDMSRIISGKVRLAVEQLDLSKVVSAAVETLKPAATAKNVRITADLDPLAEPINGDPSRLQQVFWNLLSNAVKFTPAGGCIQVTLQRVDGNLRVDVTDSGEGIKPEFLPFVFDRFRQADATTTRKHGGLGLGLSIVKQLVELHGGSVGVHSRGPGTGTTFSVTLPPMKSTESADDPSTGPRSPMPSKMQLAEQSCHSLKGVKVLVVEDEADARSLVRRLLEECDAIVTTASSAGEAIERLTADRPDVLVSDIGLPGTDGYSLIRRVRELPQHQGGNTPAVALTAYARAEDRVKAILAGFQMHIPKPVEPAELIATVASLTGRAAN